MTAYYNEIDPFAAAWLRELIEAGLIAPGDVDERSIHDVRPQDLAGYTQCHFFAGIGGWSYALRLAGWPDDRPVWTGSCPCQPFSAAGKQSGTKDDRHLWPEFFRLIRECRPDAVFGEQVAAAIGLDWLDHVSTDLEGEGYAVGSVVLGAHSVGAPHIRQRLWFVADSLGERLEERPEPHGAAIEQGQQAPRRADAGGCGGVGELANTDRTSAARFREHSRGGKGKEWIRGGPCHRFELGDTGASGLPLPQCEEMERSGRGQEGGAIKQSSIPFWSGCDWLPCRDGKARPVEPGTFPLAHGLPARVGRLRGYGNAIVPQVAAEVIKAYMNE